MFKKEDLKRMDLEDGDLVILEFPENTPPNKIRSILDEIKKSKEELNIDNPFLVIKGKMETHKLPEKELNKLGWYKLTKEEKKKLNKD